MKSRGLTIFVDTVRYGAVAAAVIVAGAYVLFIVLWTIGTARDRPQPPAVQGRQCGETENLDVCIDRAIQILNTRSYATAIAPAGQFLSQALEHSPATATFCASLPPDAGAREQWARGRCARFALHTNENCAQLVRTVFTRCSR